MGNEMDMDIDVSAFLAEARSRAPDSLKEFFTQFGDLYDRKLWHQLTSQLQSFASHADARPFLIPVYNNFVKDWAKRMNQLKLVQFAVLAAGTFAEPSESAEFLHPLLATTQSHPEAHVVASMEWAHWKLLSGDLEATRKVMEDCEKEVERLEGMDAAINASFFRVSADYYKAKASYHQFYHSALLYLASVPSLDDIPLAERQQRAADLALAALLADDLYNFGELLQHPVLESLKGSPQQWLADLLRSFNRGDMDSFEKWASGPNGKENPLLAASLPFLRQKLHLTALVERTFARTREQRSHMRFADVAKETRVKEDEVEHLVMRALSVGLVKGSIDEVERVVQITWVQTRTLDKLQIAGMRDRLGEWASKVGDMVKDLEKQEAELLVQ
ncbi:26S proteasome regulatory subunit [Gonapodya sp. JEL0774]|nr:26S proteasome regulatory subunit [Gonapodya sp. JEL0774]